MDTYTYAYKIDSKQEPIGRVIATSLQEAREQISQIKRLSVNDVDALFLIKKEIANENTIRKYQSK
jgi:hypothetical protein